MPNIKLVVFDIAGTIIEDRGEVITAFGSALEKTAISFTVDELKEWKGASKLEVIRHFVERKNSGKSLSANEIERSYKLFLSPFMIFHAMQRAGIEDVRQVVNVGDTPLDLQAGTNAVVRGVVGVLTGSHGEHRLQREPHTHPVPSVAELPSLIAHAF